MLTESDIACKTACLFSVAGTQSSCFTLLCLKRMETVSFLRKMFLFCKWHRRLGKNIRVLPTGVEPMTFFSVLLALCFTHRILLMGYSRKNPHSPDGWQEFLTPPSPRISCTSRPLPLPGFPRPETPSYPDFPDFLWALNSTFSPFKIRRIASRRWLWSSILILICSCELWTEITNGFCTSNNLIKSYFLPFL